MTKRKIDKRPWCKLVIPQGESGNPKVLAALQELLHALGFNSAHVASNVTFTGNLRTPSKHKWKKGERVVWFYHPHDDVKRAVRPAFGTVCEDGRHMGGDAKISALLVIPDRKHYDDKRTHSIHIWVRESICVPEKQWRKMNPLACIAPKSFGLREGD